ncbi:ATP-binding cassette sub-family C member 5-like [Palaemon carinicauda]|uniref:ATP-binding cassette sub-family C member 5-like n=1 Tax=Palaemon carinicauda TaxID=392227 RepID=UPI0035B64DF6
MESLADEPSESNDAAKIKPVDCDVQTTEETSVFEELPLKTSEDMPVFEESPLINNFHPEPTLKSQVKTVRIKLPPTCLHTSQEVEESNIVGTGKADHETLDNESNIDIDQDIDDALDEGYMGMECTLERGFSLNESSIARDLRIERYREVAVEYKKCSDMSRYRQALKHFIPFRKPSKEKNEMPIDRTGLYSFITYSWITNLMWKAYKTGLKEEDVPICSKYDMCGYNTDRLEKLWNEEIKNMGKDNASFHRVVLRFIKTRLIIGILIFMVTLGLGFIGPTIFMRYLISWLSSDESLTTGLIWTVGLVLSEFVRILMFGLVWSVNYRTGIRLRSACLGLIYKKLMRMSTLGNKSIGEFLQNHTTQKEVLIW